MNLIKKAVLSIFMTVFLSAGNIAFAEESAVTETIAHIEQALAEVDKGDFNGSQAHLKAARLSSDKITGNEAVVKQGYQSIVQAQIMGKQADNAKSTAALNKALGFYKSI